MKKKIPIRKCIGCQESFPKKELIRIVKNKEGEVKIDYSGKANGRGAYLCRKKECYEKAIKSNRLKKALEIDIPNIIYEEIKNEFTKNE